MPDYKLIAPVPGITPTVTEQSVPDASGLPEDLLQAASRRLGIISILAAGLWVVATILDHLAMRVMTHDTRAFDFNMSDAIAVMGVFISLGLWSFTRLDNRRPELVLDLGLAYMVLTSLALGIVIHCDPADPRAQAFPMITWVGAVILMFAAIVPNAPHKMLIAGLLAASMNPLGMYIAKMAGKWDFGPASNMILMHYPDFLLVGVAVIISQVVMKMGYQVTKAREMGSYRLVNLLGRGGMGEVWRARHRMLARDAAVKLIQPHQLSNDSANASMIRRRFEQEAKATATLRSPHTVELYDFGVTRDGIFYYVMELLDGIDLDTLVKKFGPQPAARVVWILRQVCRSLGDAHDHRMIHRDIKPSNIFICRMGNEYDYAKVLDFGLVKVVDESGSQVSNAGATTGTPAYMAPELALGSPNLDGRTDLYGLGCVGYWLLTGSLVFQEASATATMLAHVRTEPIPPSQRSELPVPEALDRAIMMCLAKEPEGRPGSADMLCRLLDECRLEQAWSTEDAEKWWMTNLPQEQASLSQDDASTRKTGPAVSSSEPTRSVAGLAGEQL